MQIKAKVLSDAGWKDVVAKNKVKDNGVQKALERLKRVSDDDHGEVEKILDELAKLIGFPGKLGMDGSKVWGAWQAGRIAEIRDYCETDALNTYLVAVRFRLMRGEFARAEYDAEMAFVRAELERIGKPHWQEFLAAWS